MDAQLQGEKGKVAVPDEFFEKFHEANALRTLKKDDEADAAYEECARLSPIAWFGIACKASEQGNINEAFELLTQAAKYAEEPATAALIWNNIGHILANWGRVESAERAFKKAIDYKPNAPALSNYGMMQSWKGDYETAMKYYDKAIRINPKEGGTYFCRGLLKLLQGDYAGGWQDYEYRFTSAGTTTRKIGTGKEEWAGPKEKVGRLLLYTEQGQGDTIQFVRYAKMARKYCDELILACQPGMRRLLWPTGWFKSITEFGEPLPEYNKHIPLLSLPRVFGTNADNIPGECPYLPAPPPAKLPGNGFKVGIAWAGSMTHKADKLRSTELKDWAPILAVPGVDFFSLQKGPQAVQLQEFPNNIKTVDTMDWYETARTITALDLVISVDTSPVHMAGAINKPVWNMIAKSPDWRWLLGRDDSPWYPSVRLFRQSEFDKWDDVFERVAADLGKAAAK